MSDYGLSSSAQSLLGKVRALFGTDNVVVTSGRASRVGVAGGSRTSQHPSGNAFDFRVNGFTPDQVQARIVQSGIPFGQSIQEYGAAAGKGINHLGVGTKGQIMTAVDGKYKTTGYAAGLPSTADGAALVGTWGDQIKAFGQAIGLGDRLGDISDATGRGLAAPGEAVESLFGGLSASDWFTRITFGVFAILLIAVALFMLSGQSPVKLASKLAPIPA